MKRKYFIIFFMLAVLAFCFIKIIYPILNISSVYPPIKEYNFSLTVDKLANEIIKISNNNANINYKITDTTGTSNDNLQYYVGIYLKNDSVLYFYDFFYNKSDKTHSTIGLVGVFDKTHKFGGYENDSKGMQKLITIFEDKFINKINRNQ